MTLKERVNLKETKAGQEVFSPLALDMGIGREREKPVGRRESGAR